MKNAVRRLLLALSLLALGAGSVMAQVTGTNAVTVLESNVDNAVTTMWPWVIGLLCVGVVISVMLRLGRKAGIRA